MQQTKQASKRDEVEEGVESEQSRSAEVSEAAACCLAEIDAVLAEVEAEPEWDPATSPQPERPDWRTYVSDSESWQVREKNLERYYVDMDVWRERMHQWHDVRGLTWREPCVC